MNIIDAAQKKQGPSKFIPEQEPQINRLPDEILLQLFSLLPDEDIRAASQVSKRWRAVSKDRSLSPVAAIFNYSALRFQIPNLPENGLKMANSEQALAIIYENNLLTFPLLQQGKPRLFQLKKEGDRFDQITQNNKRILVSTLKGFEIFEIDSSGEIKKPHAAEDSDLKDFALIRKTKKFVTSYDFSGEEKKYHKDPLASVKAVAIQRRFIGLFYEKKTSSKSTLDIISKTSKPVSLDISDYKFERMTSSGSLIALDNGRIAFIIEGSTGNPIKIISYSKKLTKGAHVTHFSINNRLLTLCFERDQKSSICTWDVISGEQLPTISLDAPVKQLEIDKEIAVIVTETSPDKVVFWSLLNGLLLDGMDLALNSENEVCHYVNFRKNRYFVLITNNGTNNEVNYWDLRC